VLTEFAVEERLRAEYKTDQTGRVAAAERDLLNVSGAKSQLLSKEAVFLERRRLECEMQIVVKDEPQGSDLAKRALALLAELKAREL
jgi:hypothetical protein